MHPGSAYWRFIHYFSIHIVDYEFIKQITNFIPDDWKSEWEDPKPNQDLANWSRELHNKINAKLGRYDKYDITDFNICQKSHCDICANDEHRHMFPWSLIHFIADKYGESSIEFLKQFNTLYPCDKYKSQLLIDEPNSQETALEWTLRNHNRINLSNNQPEYKYATSTKCIHCNVSLDTRTVVSSTSTLS